MNFMELACTYCGDNITDIYHHQYDFVCYDCLSQNLVNEAVFFENAKLIESQEMLDFMEKEGEL